jgi:hypothetical protein
VSAADTALSSRLRAEFHELERVLSRVSALTEKARAHEDADYLDGVALNLHGFYAGVERVLEAIAREVDESVPAGPEWHRDLLMQMSGEVKGVRPPVLSDDTKARLDDYRGFRHVVRNVYTFQLRSSRIFELADDLPGCHESLKRDMEAFFAFLEGLGDAKE